mmetsp:Transcript_54251/g.126767  ORF Transcript_54251/g.126767 Transcript_54251/m.126767 type:complete len:81 (+) Transcript_54251:788-1030(+)
MPTEFGAGGGGDRGSGGGRWVRGDFPPAIAPYSLDSDASGSDSNQAARYYNGKHLENHRCGKRCEGERKLHKGWGEEERD